jgi:hypothetical protein
MPSRTGSGRSACQSFDAREFPEGEPARPVVTPAPARQESGVKQRRGQQAEQHPPPGRRRPPADCFRQVQVSQRELFRIHRRQGLTRFLAQGLLQTLHRVVLGGHRHQVHAIALAESFEVLDARGKRCRSRTRARARVSMAISSLPLTSR